MFIDKGDIPQTEKPPPPPITERSGASSSADLERCHGQTRSPLRGAGYNQRHTSSHTLCGVGCWEAEDLWEQIDLIPTPVTMFAQLEWLILTATYWAQREVALERSSVKPSPRTSSWRTLPPLWGSCWKMKTGFLQHLSTGATAGSAPIMSLVDHQHAVRIVFYLNSRYRQRAGAWLRPRWKERLL